MKWPANKWHHQELKPSPYSIRWKTLLNAKMACIIRFQKSHRILWNSWQNSIQKTRRPQRDHHSVEIVCITVHHFVQIQIVRLFRKSFHFDYILKTIYETLISKHKADTKIGTAHRHPRPITMRHFDHIEFRIDEKAYMFHQMCMYWVAALEQSWAPARKYDGNSNL